MDSKVSRPLLITEYGKRALGDMARSSRQAMNWSLDDLVLEIRVKTGERLSKTAINYLERGYSAPAWDTLAILAATEYIKADGRLLSAHDLFDVACEAATYDSSHVAVIPKGAEIKRSIGYE